jgi:protoporphyrin/coproporphyrin ferrochelatase
MQAYALLLMAYGGPYSLDELGPFLRDVRGGRPLSQEALAQSRVRYAATGGKSPLPAITTAQASAAAALLNSSGLTAGCVPFVGMRHWHPYIAESVAEIRAAGLTRIIAICMSPHYSRQSVGAYLEKLSTATAGLPLQVAGVKEWYNHSALIEALSRQAQEALTKFPPGDRPYLLCSAHSLPAGAPGDTDIYSAQLTETARLLAERLGYDSGAWEMCYQSVPNGVSGWLGPQLEVRIVQLAGVGERRQLVVPIGFLTDHVEILYDIDIDCQTLASEHGVQLVRSASLNTHPLLISAVADLAARELVRF